MGKSIGSTASCWRARCELPTCPAVDGTCSSNFEPRSPVGLSASDSIWEPPSKSLLWNSAHELGMNGLPGEIISLARRTLTRLRRATTPWGLLLTALSRNGRNPFRDFRDSLESHLEDRIGRGDHGSGCVFDRLASPVFARSKRLGTDALRDELITVFVATVGGLSCSLKHSLYWAITTPRGSDTTPGGDGGHGCR